MPLKLTISKLMEILTPEEDITLPDKISLEIYVIRKGILMSELNIIIEILTNYLAAINESIKRIPLQNTANTILARFKNIKCTNYNGLYRYLIRMNAILYYIKLLNYNLDDTIKYEKIQYEYKKYQ